MRFGVSKLVFRQEKQFTTEILEERLMEEVRKIVGSGVHIGTRVIPATDIKVVLEKDNGI